MKTTSTALLMSIAAAMLSACGNTPVNPAPSATVAAKPAPQQPAPVRTESKVTPVVVPDHLNPNSQISKDHIVYFDFDDYSVKPQYGTLLALHARYLASHPELAIKVAGNADERGSTEYNLALGQKRAEAVTKAMKVYGVKDRQMEAVSWGEEKPRATGHDEAAWAQNRRAELDYPKK